jgi:FxsC-like protein
MDYWFFLSYARRDAIGREYLKRFYEDLAREVASKAGLRSNLKESDVGFFDEIGIEAGDHWPKTMANALQRCRVFVCLFSRGYFNSEYCGKELQVFLDRVKTYAIANKIEPPPVVMPVLWDRPDMLPVPLPAAVSDLQYTHDSFGKLYSKEGLSFLMRLQRNRDEYELFLMEFAEKLVRVGGSAILPAFPAMPPLSEVKSIFHSRPTNGAATVLDTAGPRFVQFVFVAGRRQEFQGTDFRKRLDYYGDEGGLDWHPYLPDVPDEVAIMAQEVAVAEKLRYEVLSLDDGIIGQLEEAQRRNKVVAIIVDTWTLRLQPYHAAMREYDRHLFSNCEVLVVWNNLDDETVTSRSSLQDAVRVTFLNRIGSKDTSFLEWVGSPAELKTHLSATLNRVRMRIIEQTEVIKRVESAHVIAKPVITGPGRAI